MCTQSNSWFFRWFIFVSILGDAWVVITILNLNVFNKWPCASSWCRIRGYIPILKKICNSCLWHRYTQVLLALVSQITEPYCPLVPSHICFTVVCNQTQSVPLREKDLLLGLGLGLHEKLGLRLRRFPIPYPIDNEADTGRKMAFRTTPLVAKI
jgi:hypothetical protein